MVRLEICVGLVPLDISICGTIFKMGKFDYRELPAGDRIKFTEQLAEVLAHITDKRQMRELITTLLTPSELIMLARRLEIASRLLEGKSYATIRKEIKVGISTVQSVDSWLEHTVRDYQNMRSKQIHEQKALKKLAEARLRKRSGSVSPLDIRHQQPNRWWFINLLLD